METQQAVDQLQQMMLHLKSILALNQLLFRAKKCAISSSYMVTPVCLYGTSGTGWIFERPSDQVWDLLFKFLSVHKLVRTHVNVA